MGELANLESFFGYMIERVRPTRTQRLQMADYFASRVRHIAEIVLDESKEPYYSEAGINRELAKRSALSAIKSCMDNPAPREVAYYARSAISLHWTVQDPKFNSKEDASRNELIEQMKIVLSVLRSDD